MLVDGQAISAPPATSGCGNALHPNAAWPRSPWKWCDIDKDTVDFLPNYDGKTQEPTVPPARFPNLLCNGSSGIAVGIMPPTSAAQHA